MMRLKVAIDVWYKSSLNIDASVFECLMMRDFELSIGVRSVLPLLYICNSVLNRSNKVNLVSLYIPFIIFEINLEYSRRSL